MRCATQWRVGASGPVGLDYTALFQVMEIYPVEDKREAFEGVQAIEAKILSLIGGEK